LDSPLAPQQWVNWVYAFKDRPLVAGVVSHSGNQFSFPANTLELAESHWYNVTETLGCGTSGDTLECMRSPNITFQQILAAMKLVPATPTSSPARSQPAFQVTIDNQTWFTSAEYVSRVKAGALAQIPYLQIHGNHESGFYRISALAQGTTLSEEDWSTFEQETFTCPTAAEGFYRSQLGISTYRFRYMAEWENTRLYDPPSSGAYHGVDIYMITGNSGLVSNITPTDSQSHLTSIMSSAWYYYSADAVAGLSRDLGWPKYQPNAATLGLAGAEDTGNISFISPTTYDGVCPNLDLEFWDYTIPV
jgi:cholinesterase